MMNCSPTVSEDCKLDVFTRYDYNSQEDAMKSNNRETIINEIMECRKRNNCKEGPNECLHF